MGCIHRPGLPRRVAKHAFPEPTVSAHDPEGYFPPGRELTWFEFNSSSTRFDVMYREWFCGKSGPRTIFTIQSVEGVSVKTRTRCCSDRSRDSA